MLGMTSVPSGPSGGEQRLDELDRAGADPGERGVHQEHTARLHAERR